jgi:hAT family C-terminal dimerisation region
VRPASLLCAAPQPFTLVKVRCLQATFDRRWKQRGGAARAPIMNPTYAAAYMLDPMFAVLSADGCYEVPEVGLEMKNEVKDLILRVGGVTAEDTFSMLVLQGWPQALTRDIRAIVEGLAGSKRTGNDSFKPKMPRMRARLGLWEKGAKGTELEPLLDVARRVLSAHVTTAATERDWSMWGRVYNSTRNALGQDRAKKMIAVCSESKARKLSKEREFEVTLQIIDGEPEND